MEDLNSVVRPRSFRANCPDYFIKGDDVLRDKSEVVNKFYPFFVNIGPSLAKFMETKIKEDVKIPGESGILQSIFLGGISENEILTIVKKSKNKTSVDRHGIDMTIVKKTTDYVVKPFTYVCNLSVQNGIFPEKMKMLKLFRYLKTVIDTALIITDQSQCFPSFLKCLKNSSFRN
uniref:Uncharacterized protein n=1 Tax=Nothobranchius pienaari TaxID=704102 RepID=A0A1A8PVC6_9TELE